MTKRVPLLLPLSVKPRCFYNISQVRPLLNRFSLTIQLLADQKYTLPLLAVLIKRDTLQCVIKEQSIEECLTFLIIQGVKCKLPCTVATVPAVGWQVNTFHGFFLPKRYSKAKRKMTTPLT